MRPEPRDAIKHQRAPHKRTVILFAGTERVNRCANGFSGAPCYVAWSASMRAVVQRVSRASVTVEGKVVGQIGPGVLVLLGVARDDTEGDAVYLAEKICGLRIFEDDDGKMNRSVSEVHGSVLAVSQFTLYGDVRRGK